MAVRRYEISLRVLKNISRVSASNYFINTNELPNQFTLIVFWCERWDLLCSHSNGDIFTCEDIKFSRKSSSGPQAPQLIQIQILQTDVHTFLKELVERICLLIKDFSIRWSFHLFSQHFPLIMY